MKRILFLLTIVAFAGCSRPSADHAASHERPPENGAQFKDREGVALTDVMKKSIGLKVAEVEDAKVAPEFTVPLHVLSGSAGIPKVALSAMGSTASGWLTAEEAAHAQPGTVVSLRADGVTTEGVVKSVEKSPYPASGDFEVTVEAKAPLEIGTRVVATFQGSAGEAGAAVPSSALLKTAEGAFVYVLNGERYVRTPVKLAAVNHDRVQIADGLYSGDQVVTNGVMPLWLAELQVLRGGKACTCGH